MTQLAMFKYWSVGAIFLLFLVQAKWVHRFNWVATTVAFTQSWRKLKTVSAQRDTLSQGLVVFS